MNQLVQLRTLDIRCNQNRTLNGVRSIGDSLGNLGNLQALRLSFEDFTGRKAPEKSPTQGATGDSRDEISQREVGNGRRGKGKGSKSKGTKGKGVKGGTASGIMLRAYVASSTDVYTGELSSIMRSLRSLSQLQKLQLCFSNSSEFSDAEFTQFGSSVSALVHLQVLEVNLSRCKQVADMGTLGRSLIHLTKLRVLNLDLSNTAIADVSMLGNAACGFAQLETLKINLTACKAVVNVTALSGLAALTHLEKLQMQLRHCKITDITPLLSVLGTLLVLTDLDLQLCRLPITDAAALSVSLWKLTKLQTLQVDFQGCNNLSLDVPGLCNAVRGLTQLHSLSIDLSGCRKLGELACPLLMENMSGACEPLSMSVVPPGMPHLPSEMQDDLDHAEMLYAGNQPHCSS